MYCSLRAVVIILQALQQLRIGSLLQSSSSTLVCFFCHHDSNLLYSIIKKQGPCDDFFDELDDFGTDTTINKLEEYLNMPIISTKGLEPLTWWRIKPPCSYGN